MPIYVQERPWDPFSPHVLVGEPTGPDPSGAGGTGSSAPPAAPQQEPLEEETTVEPAAEVPAAPPPVKRRRTARRKAKDTVDPQLAQELAGLERPE